MKISRLVFLIIVIACTPYVNAQAINTHHFHFGDTLEIPTMESALGKDSELIQSGQRFLFRASYDYSNDLLTGTTTANPNTFSFVDNIQTLDVGGGVLIHPRFWVGIDAPLHFIKLSDAYVAGSFDPTAWKFGDMALYAKLKLTNNDSRINIAFRPQLTFPTGSRQYFVSDDSYGIGGRILLDSSVHQWKFFTHAGVAYASNAEFSAIDRTTTLDYGIGTFYEINRRFALNGEWIQSISVSDASNGQNPTQFDLGLRYNAGSARIFAGGGFHSLKFSSTHRPLLFFAGVKLPLGKKISPSVPPPAESAASASVETPVPNSDLTDALEYLSTLIIYFDNNHYYVKNEYKDALNKAATLLLTHGDQIQYVLLLGYSDPRGDEPYNQLLSEKRAKIVKKYLVRQGVNGHVILTDGYGESDTKVTEQKTYDKDRRVEFRVIKK